MSLDCLVKAAQLMSDEIRLDELWVALETVLQKTSNKRRKVLLPSESGIVGSW